MAEPGGLTAEATAPAEAETAQPAGLQGVFELIEAGLEAAIRNRAAVRQADLVLASRRVSMRAWDEPTAALTFSAFSHLVDEPSDRLLHPGDAEVGQSSAGMQKSVAGPGVAGAIDVWRGDGDEVRAEFRRLLANRGSDDLVDSSLRDSANGLLVTVEPRSGIVTALDRPRRRGYVIVPDPDRLGWWHQAAPLRFALHGLIAGPDLCLAHAGAIALSGGPAALLAGPGGSGKSTLALAGVLGGLDYLGDDYVFVAAEPEPVTHSLFAKAKLTDASIAMLPGVAAARIEEPVVGPAILGAPKATLDVAVTWPRRMRRSAPLAALVAPRLPRPGEPPGLRTVPPARAVLALAPSTTFQLPGLDGDALAMAAALARRLPAHELVLSGDPGADAALVAGLLERLR